MLQVGQIMKIDSQTFVVLSVKYYEITDMDEIPKIKHLELLGLR